MKKIILVDRGLVLVDQILEKTDFTIAVLIVSTDKQKKIIYKNERINKVYTVGEIEKIEKIGEFDYQLIKEFRNTQLKVENALNRFTNDYQIRKNIYYKALAFWNKIFQEQEIGLVVIKGVNHGLPYDCIPHDMGIKYNIPTYILELTLNTMQSLYDCRKEEFVEISNNKNITNEIEKCRFYVNDFDKAFFEATNKDNFIKRKIKQGFYFFGGAMMTKLVSCLWRSDFNCTIGDSSISMNYFNILKCYFNSKSIKNYIDSISSNYDKNQKYVFYALHFEPEASIQCKHVLESQLLIIKILAESLPEGWKLYVKEHPYQYDINKAETDYMIANVDIFKSKLFYEEIIKLKNVELIKIETPSKDIIKDAKAIATMVGTIALEAVNHNKPVLLFAHLKSPFRYAEDYFGIDSMKKCREALAKIDAGFSPQYNDVQEVCARYFTTIDDNGNSVLIETLIKDLAKYDKR